MIRLRSKFHVILIVLFGFLAAGCLGGKETLTIATSTVSTPTSTTREETAITPRADIPNQTTVPDLIFRDRILGDGSIYDVHPSPDGTLIAIDHSLGITIHQKKTFEKLWAIQLSSGSTLDMVWSPDSQVLQIIRQDADGRLSVLAINTKTGFIQESYKLNPTSTEAYFGPNGTLLAEIDDTALIIRSVKTGEQLTHIEFGEASSFLKVSWSPDGNLVAASSSTTGVGVWEVSTGHVIMQVQDDIYLAFDLVFSPDSQSLLIASQANLVYVQALAYGVWNLQTGQSIWLVKEESTDIPVNQFRWEEAGLYGWKDMRRGTDILIRFDPQSGRSIWEQEANSAGGLLISNHSVLAFNTGMINWIDSETGTILKKTFTLRGYSLQALMDNQVLLKAPDGIILYESDGTLIKQSSGYLELRSAIFSPSSDQLAIASRTRIYVWDVQTGDLVNDFPLTGLLGWSPEGDRLAVVTETGKVVIFDIASDKEVGHYSTNLITPSGVAWLAENRLLIGGSISEKPIFFNENQSEPYIERETILFTMDASTGEYLQTIPVDGEPYSIVLASDGTQIAYATGNQNPAAWAGEDAPPYINVTVTIRDSIDLAEIQIIPLSDDWINTLLWESSGTQILGLTESGSFIWDVNTGQEISSLGIQFVYAAAWSPELNKIMFFSEEVLIVMEQNTAVQTTLSEIGITGDAIAFAQNGSGLIIWNSRSAILTLVILSPTN